ncbi:hypothetical protein JMJ35_000411 [Cladonia borealis]|uniref:Uncharacterized protein n=1 Tax=Cladonia borealis TaxID=184061 RepID=A0AA39UF56_9LECA|nr:hypothetical protein JMJ35_000411 [Cladonia borealis]
MESASVVDSRTKEPFSMDDQSSVTSTLTYQATFEEQSNIDSSSNSTPRNSPKATVVEALQSSKLDSVEYRSGSRPELQHDPTDRSAANLTPATRSNNRGRSKSPRPVVTAEARARWAMLASLAGITKDDNLAEDEEEGQRAPDASKQSSDPFSDPHLKPLHILDPSGDAASIERYLLKLEKDPHVDNDLLQEGLQASKRLSNDYTKGQQAITRNRGQSSVMESQANSQRIRQEVHDQQMERKRPGERGAEQDLQDRHRIARDEASIAASLPANAQILEDKARAIGHGVEHGYEDAKLDIEGNVSTTSRKAEAILHTLGDHSIAEGLEKRVHGVEGAVESIGSELRVPNIRRDVGNAEADLSLAGKKTMRNFREDKHDVDAGFGDAERLVEDKLPGLDIRHDIQKSGHDLKDGLHKLEGVNLERDVRNGEHELKDGLHKLEGVGLARDVGKSEHELKEEMHKFEGGDLARDVKKGEHELKEELHKIEGGDLTRDVRKGKHELKEEFHKIEGGTLTRDVKKGEHELKEDLRKLEGGGLARDVRRGEHDLDAGLRHAERTVENALPGGHILQDVQKGEHELKVDMRDAGKAIEKDLNGPNLERDFRRGEHDLGAHVNGILESAKNVLPGTKRDIRDGEQILGNSLFRDASKVEKALPGLDLHHEASEVARDLTKGFRKDADAVEREFRKADGHGLVNEFGKDGRAVEHNLERLGTSTVGHINRDEHALGRDARAMGRSAENVGKDVGRSEEKGVRMGEQAVNQAMKAASDLRPLDNERTQGHDRAGNNGPPRSPNVPLSGTGMGKPATSNSLTNMGEHSRLHSQGILEERGKPDDHRATQLNGKGLQNHGLALQNPPQAPLPLMAQHGPVRPPTNPAQLRPSLAPTGLRAPHPTMNEATRATMPGMPGESHHLSPMGQAPTQRGSSEISHQLGSNKITPNSSQAPGPNTKQSGQTSAQSRLAERAQAPRSNEINPRLSQSAVPPIESNSFRPDQQRHGGNQIRNQDFQPSPALPQSDRYQALSTNRPPQPRQPGANPPSISNVKVPAMMPSPSVDAANLGPQHRQETRGQDKPNNQLGKGTPQHRQETRGQDKVNHQLSKGTPPQQAQNSRGIRQSNLVPSSQYSKQQEPGTIAKSTAEDQRKAQIEGDGKAAARLAQNPLSQTKGPQQKANPSILPFHARTNENEAEFQRDGQRSNATALQSQSNSATKRLSQTTTHVPSPISGPQQMLNMFKARSQASIDAAGACPGFMDQMIQSLCKMGQDAMPEIERRLAANQG